MSWFAGQITGQPWACIGIRHAGSGRLRGSKDDIYDGCGALARLSVDGKPDEMRRLTYPVLVHGVVRLAAKTSL